MTEFEKRDLILQIMNLICVHLVTPDNVFKYSISGIECVCQKNARLRVLLHVQSFYAY